MPPHEKVVLKNGLTVLLLQKHGVPLVNISTIVKAGAVADPAGQDGLATVTAELLRKGTKMRTAQQFSADLDYIGGIVRRRSDVGLHRRQRRISDEGSRSRPRIVFRRAPASDIPRRRNDKASRAIRRLIRAAKDDPQSVVDSVLLRLSLRDASLRTLEQRRRNLAHQNPSRRRRARFYEANYAPSNTIIAIAGEFNVDEMKSKLEQTFGAWPARTVKQEAIPPVDAGKREAAAARSTSPTRRRCISRSATPESAPPIPIASRFA